MDETMVQIVVWFAVCATYFTMCVTVAWAAQQRGRSGGWWAVALFLTPVFALLLLVAAGEKQDVEDR